MGQGLAETAEVDALFERLTRHFSAQGITLATMESCTAGEIANLITNTEGSSAVLKGGFVTYCNEAKVTAGVPAETIARFGVYSQQTAAAMAHAARRAFGAQLGIGVTGTFGNVDEANADSVPGEVHAAFARAAGTEAFTLTVPGALSRAQAKSFVARALAERLLAGA